MESYEENLTDERRMAAIVLPTQPFWEGLRVYGDQRDYTVALSLFVDAYQTTLELEPTTPNSQLCDLHYYLFKAWKLSSNDRSRIVQLPMNAAHLENLVASDVHKHHRQAVWMATYFGRLGLKVHDLLEHRRLARAVRPQVAV